MNPVKTLAKSALAFTTGIGSYITAITVASAQTYEDWLGVISFGNEGTDLVSFVQGLLSFVIGAVALVAVVMLIWNGVMYITAGGDEGKVEKATKGITNAVIGLVICFIAELIVRFVISLVMGN